MGILLSPEEMQREIWDRFGTTNMVRDSRHEKAIRDAQHQRAKDWFLEPCPHHLQDDKGRPIRFDCYTCFEQFKEAK